MGTDGIVAVEGQPDRATPITSRMLPEDVADFVAALFQPERPGAERWLPVTTTSQTNTGEDSTHVTPSTGQAPTHGQNAQSRCRTSAAALLDASLASSSTGENVCILRRSRFAVPRRIGTGILRALVFLDDDIGASEATFRRLESCAVLHFA